MIFSDAYACNEIDWYVQVEVVALSSYEEKEEQFTEQVDTNQLLEISWSFYLPLVWSSSYNPHPPSLLFKIRLGI